jgi:hypothetical protein
MTWDMRVTDERSPLVSLGVVINALFLPEYELRNAPNCRVLSNVLPRDLSPTPRDEGERECYRRVTNGSN